MLCAHMLGIQVNYQINDAICSIFYLPLFLTNTGSNSFIHSEVYNLQHNHREYPAAIQSKQQNAAPNIMQADNNRMEEKMKQEVITFKNYPFLHFELACLSIPSIVYNLVSSISVTL